MSEVFKALSLMATPWPGASIRGTDARRTFPDEVPYGRRRPRLYDRTLGDFILRQRIGKGGCGFVYRSEQLPLGRKVVVKVTLLVCTALGATA